MASDTRQKFLVPSSMEGTLTQPRGVSLVAAVGDEPDCSHGVRQKSPINTMGASSSKVRVALVIALISGFPSCSRFSRLCSSPSSPHSHTATLTKPMADSVTPPTSGFSFDLCRRYVDEERACAMILWMGWRFFWRASPVFELDRAICLLVGALSSIHRDAAMTSSPPRATRCPT